MSDDLDRFRELSFLFVCRKLDDADMAWMAALLERHPALAAAVDADRKLAARARTALDASYHAAAPLLSFEQAMAGARAPSPMQGLRAWMAQAWRRSSSPAWTRGALALLAVCATLQTYRLETLRSDQQQDHYRGVAGQAAAARATLKVIFSDQLSMGELRAMMAAMKLDIVAGPDEQGVVRVAVGEGSTEQALARLQGHKMVIDVHVVVGGK
jgi:hypothetical protein